MAPSTVSGWRFVESDLYRIASQVTEYDEDARLVRRDSDGQLALARWHRSNAMGTPGYWLLARDIYDLDTDRPLCGEPDSRIMRFMRSCDNRGRNLRVWHHRSQDAVWRAEKREYDAVYDQNGDYAEQFVHALSKDVSAKPRAFFADRSAA